MNPTLLLLLGVLYEPVVAMAGELIEGDADEAIDAALAGLVATVDGLGDRIPGWSKFPRWRQENMVRAAVVLLDAAIDAGRDDYDGDGRKDTTHPAWLLKALASKGVHGHDFWKTR